MGMGERAGDLDAFRAEILALGHLRRTASQSWQNPLHTLIKEIEWIISTHFFGRTPSFQPRVSIPRNTSLIFSIGILK